MNVRSLEFAIVTVLMFLIAFLWVGDIGFSKKAFGQAEETFGQNTTFLEEVEQMQRQTQSATQSIQDQTNTTARQISSPVQQQLTELIVVRTQDDSYKPRVLFVTSGENVYVGWEINTTGNWEVMFKASHDSGQTFQDKINLSNSTETDSKNAGITASDSKVFVYWQENNPDNSTGDPVFRISDDNGQTFGPIMHLSGDSDTDRQTFSNYSLYNNSDYGIKMQYPSEWQIKNGQDTNNKSVIDISGFLSPFEYRLDKYREKLWISRDNLTAKNVSLEEYSKGLIDYKNETSQDFKLLDYNSDSNVLAGYPAYRLVYTDKTVDGLTIKQMEIGTKIDDKVYYLNYYAEEKKYDDLLPVIYDMIKSFNVNNNSMNRYLPTFR